MIKIGYKLLTPTAIAPAIAFNGTDNTMGIDIYTDQEVVLLAGNTTDISHSCNTALNKDSDHLCSCHPHGSVLPYANISTGIALELPPGVHVSWGGRSGLAFKQGLMPFEGKIDSNYRGEIAVKMWSLDPAAHGRVIPAGSKIAQLYILQYNNQYALSKVIELSSSDRGTAGFGSTGL